MAVGSRRTEGARFSDRPVPRAIIEMATTALLAVAILANHRPELRDAVIRLEPKEAKQQNRRRGDGRIVGPEGGSLFREPIVQSSLEPGDRAPAGVEDNFGRIDGEHIGKTEGGLGLLAGPELGAGPCLHVRVAGRKEKRVDVVDWTQHHHRIGELDSGQVEEVRALPEGADIAIAPVVAGAPQDHGPGARRRGEPPSPVAVDRG